MKAKSGSMKREQKEIPKVGVYLARCYGVADLGEQTEKSLKYGDKQKQKLQISFELVQTNHVFKEENGPQPFVISNRYTNSMDERANLRKAINDWFGIKLTDKQAESFDFTKLLNKPLQISITHTDKDKDKDGIVFANIGSMIPIVEGTKVPSLRNKAFVFNMSEPQENFYGVYAKDCVVNNPVSAKECFDKFHKQLQDTIAKSPEWQAYSSGVSLTTASSEVEDNVVEDVDDDLPY